MPTSLMNENFLLVLVGFIILVANLIIDMMQVRKGQPHAGLLSVGLVIVACIVIGVGLVRAASQMTSEAERPIPLVTVVAGALVIVAASWLYRYHRQPTSANSTDSTANADTNTASATPGRSIGLLNAAAGAFVIIAALGSPFVAAQINGGGTQSQVVPAVVLAAPTDVTPTTEAARSATPTGDPTATPTSTATLPNTPTPLPSLTPTASETPIILSTPIVYVSTYAVVTPTSCTVIARTPTYLRGDPSEKIAAIGTIIAGSLLSVTGRTANKQWWRVVNTQGPVSVEGWVRADVVTADSTCTDQAVPVVDGTSTPTRTPTASTASVVTHAVTPGLCALLTTMSASLRPDPSRQHAPLAQIPEKTALTPLGRTADGQWWHVTYGNQDGWIGAGAVLASADCSTIPTVAAS